MLPFFVWNTAILYFRFFAMLSVYIYCIIFKFYIFEFLKFLREIKYNEHYYNNFIKMKFSLVLIALVATISGKTLDQLSLSSVDAPCEPALVVSIDSLNSELDKFSRTFD
jgi:hypothetical protein